MNEEGVIFNYQIRSQRGKSISFDAALRGHPSLLLRMVMVVVLTVCLSVWLVEFLSPGTGYSADSPCGIWRHPAYLVFSHVNEERISRIPPPLVVLLLIG